MRSINDISESVRRGERITAEDALKLWREAPLWLLGELATERKIEASGKEVYYNRNVHLEPTNICLFNCEFCSFRRREGDKDAWYMSLDDIEARAMELRGTDITEVHIVGGVHPKHDLDT
ncbi:MAG: aminofutalosine synthase MqnE, partial [Alistipes sp.]|nr:aminofutalosine synthase MqnE [Alistipes sp.]